MHESIYNENYKQEINLVKANGNDEEALRERYKQYRNYELDLLDEIKRRSLELLARKAALDYMSIKIK